MPALLMRDWRHSMIDKVVAPTALDPGSIRRPDAAETMPDESRERIDSALADLQANKDKWVRLDIRERIAILDRIMEDLPTVAERWVAMGIEAKGIERGAYGEGEEWASFAFGLRNIRLLRKSLRDIQERGRPAIPGPVTTRDDGQVVARVFPASVFDRLAVPNTTAEVWMQPGVTE